MENQQVRKIIHIDMDAFYASIEQRDNPEYKGRPLIVGGTPQQRGVVAACSYEARKFGIHSAMATARAIQLCPGVIVLPPRFDAYEHVSRQINRIFRLFTDIIEPLSLDEAYLDVTKNKSNETSAGKIAAEIRARIFKHTKLTASAGVSYNKFLAKCASDHNKPDGLTVITPAQAPAFIEKLPIGKFYGVGRVTEGVMKKLGINTGKDLKKFAKSRLIEVFGKQGNFFFDLARGIDNRPVETGSVRKSIGREHTYPEDILDLKRIRAELMILSEELFALLEDSGEKPRTITLKIKYHDFVQITRSVTIKHAISGADDIYNEVSSLLKKTKAGEKKIRLLGISASGLSGSQENGQLELF